MSIGGGYQDTSISDITLAWMVTQLSDHLDFDPEYLSRQQQQNVQFYQSKDVPVSSWAMGVIEESDTGLLNTILGKMTRTPGRYYATDPNTGKPTNRRLANTNEFVHPSVHYRMAEKGPGLVKSATTPAQGTYQPKALKGWAFANPGGGPALPNVRDMSGPGEWNECGQWTVKESGGATTLVVEEKIEDGTQEMALLSAWGKNVAAKVLAG